MASPSEKPVESLGEFMTRVSEYREFWELNGDRELWFRGEGKDYGITRLHPELYRPAKDKALKPIAELLEIEDTLYAEFKRLAVERCDAISQARGDWNWDSYFLMQHHDGPTRLLDWSDGALMALHFSIRTRKDDSEPGDSYVYVLEPGRLVAKLRELPDRRVIEDQWKTYIRKNPRSDPDDEEDWEDMYLPPDASEDGVGVPRPPLLLDFDLITRRFAAQRSRFVLFGTDPRWMADELEKSDSCIKRIVVARDYRRRMRQELRDCGVTESVIYPDLDGLGREMRQRWEDSKS